MLAKGWVGSLPPHLKVIAAGNIRLVDKQVKLYDRFCIHLFLSLYKNG